MIACFLSNISAKYYKNPSMLSRVIDKNVGDVFLRHSVDPVNLRTPFHKSSCTVQRTRRRLLVTGVSQLLDHVTGTPFLKR